MVLVSEDAPVCCCPRAFSQKDSLGETQSQAGRQAGRQADAQRDQRPAIFVSYSLACAAGGSPVRPICFFGGIALGLVLSVGKKQPALPVCTLDLGWPPTASYRAFRVTSGGEGTGAGMFGDNGSVLPCLPSGPSGPGGRDR